jgi:hypothetical protein
LGSSSYLSYEAKETYNDSKETKYDSNETVQEAKETYDAKENELGFSIYLINLYQHAVYHSRSLLPHSRSLLSTLAISINMQSI